MADISSIDTRQAEAPHVASRQRDILHRVGIKGPPRLVYAALTTIPGLSAWWTTTTRGDTAPGGRIHFQFGDRGFFDIAVVELEPDRRVVWKVVDGPAEWVGTRISFDLVPADDFTIVLFRHAGWPEAVEFMSHCSTKWAVFLLSLKALVETGTGAAYPNDVKIDNWN